MINLIKAGCFGDPIKKMKVYARYLAINAMPSKFGLTQAKKYPQALQDNKMQNNLTLISTLKSEDNFVGTRANKKVYCVDYKYTTLCNGLKYDTDWWEDGDEICITDKAIDKMFKSELNSIKEYVKTVEFSKNYCAEMAKDIYQDLIKGNEDIKQWQFESTSYYHTSNIYTKKLMKKYGFVNFEDMSEVPTFQWREGRKGSWREYDLYSMPVTIVGKNDIRHTISGLTADDQVITCRMQDGEYAYYKAKTKYDSNWFERGNLLILHGYRQGEEFRLKKYSSGLYEHTVYKIEDIHNDELTIRESKL